MFSLSPCVRLLVRTTIVGSGVSMDCQIPLLHLKGGTAYRPYGLQCCCLPSTKDLQGPQPQFEYGSVYRQNRPTRVGSNLSLGTSQASKPKLEDGTCFSARWWAGHRLPRLMKERIGG